MAGKYGYDNSIEDSLIRSKSGSSIKKDPPASTKNISSSSTTLDKSNPKVTPKIDGSKLNVDNLPQNLSNEIKGKAWKSSVLSPNEVNLLKAEIAERDEYDLTDEDEAADLDKATSDERKLIELKRWGENIDLELGVFLEKQDPNSELIRTLADKNLVTVLDKKEAPKTPDSVPQNLSGISPETQSSTSVSASAVADKSSVTDKKETSGEKKESVGSRIFKNASSMVKERVGGVLATGARERAADFVSGLSRNQKIAVAAGGLAAGVGLDLLKKRKARKDAEASMASESAGSPVSAVSTPAGVSEKSPQTSPTESQITSRAESTPTTVSVKPSTPAAETKPAEDKSIMQSVSDIGSSNSSASPQQADRQISESSTTLSKSTESTSSQKEISPNQEIFLEMSKTLNSINRNLSTPLSIRNTEPFRPASNKF